MDYRLSEEYCGNTEDYAQQHIGKRKPCMAALHKALSFIGKGGKCGKAAAHTHLQHQRDFGVKCYILCRSGSNESQKEAAENINNEGFYGKAVGGFHGYQPREIAQNRSHESTDTNKNTVQHKITYLKIYVSIIQTVGKIVNKITFIDTVFDYGTIFLFLLGR